MKNIFKTIWFNYIDQFNFLYSRSNDYDRIIKENFGPLLPHLCRVVLGIDLSHMEPMEAKIQVTIERELDHLKKVIHNDPAQDYCLHWEIQSDDEDMRRRNFL